MVFYTLILQFYLKNEQKKKKKYTFLRGKKTEKTQNRATMMISVDGK